MDRKNEIGITETRPWGNFTILDEGNGYKVKRLEVFPSMRLSYQSHEQRSEHWFVVSGTATVTLNDKEIEIFPGGSLDIPAGSKHRVANPDKLELLIFIETQTGVYLGEDDIERFDDDFGRAG